MTNDNYQDRQAALQGIIQECTQIIQNDPASIPAFGRMGDAYMQLHQHDQAMKAYKNVLKIDYMNASALIALATIYVLTNKLEEAFKTAKKSLEFSTGNMHALGIIAAVHERKRQPEKILRLLEGKINSGDTNPVLVLPYARALSQDIDQSKAIKLLEESTAHKENVGDYLISTHFLLGKLYDKQKNYDEAFSHFEKANSLRYIYFDTSRPTVEQELIRDCFTADFMKKRQPSGVSTERPVFIIGMPRSGTTLVDRIISSHPESISAGELVELPKIIETMCQSLGLHNSHFTSCVTTLSNEQISLFAQQYLQVLESNRFKAKRITDKMPVNFMYLGMIEILFPNAKIINCIRNPADLCLSCYIQDFHGFKPFLNDLDEIAMVYRNYKILMDHWKSVLSIPIHDVEYEKLVAEPGTEIPELIDFIGLPWNDRCLNFHEEGQFINTVSYDQVDKPIYQSSVSRWKNYEKYIEPLKKSLGEYWVE